MIGLNLLSVLSLAVDTAMCGRLPRSADALAAIGFASQVVFLLMVAMMGLSVGAVALMARAHGAGNDRHVAHVLRQATLLTIALSVAVAIFGNILAGPLLSAMGAGPELVGLGLEYLRPLLACTVVYYLNLLYAAALRAVGNTRLPFFIGLLYNALNVALDYGLILGNWGLPAMGVAGAAWATVLSQSVGVVITVWMLARGMGLRGRIGVRRPLGSARIDPVVIKRILRIGAPAAADLLILNAAFISIIGMLGHLSVLAVAAHSVGLRIQSLALVPGLGISQATGAMVGQALGARNLIEAREVTRASIVMATSVMGAIGFGIIMGARPIMAIFDITPGPLADLCNKWMEVLGFGMPFVGVHIALVGMLRGAGATATSLRINLVGTLLVQIPLSYLLGFVFKMGPFGVWFAFPVSFVVKAGLSFAVYRRGRWARPLATA